MASKEGRVAVVEFLIKAGAKMNEKLKVLTVYVTVNIITSE